MLVQGFQAHFDRVYYQVDVSEYKAERIDREGLEAVKRFFDCFYVKSMKTFRVEPVLIADCYYPDRDDTRSKVILNKIATGAAHRQSDDQYFKDVDEHYAALRPLFGERWDFDALFARMCRSTVEIAKGPKPPSRQAVCSCPGISCDRKRRNSTATAARCSRPCSKRDCSKSPEGTG